MFRIRAWVPAVLGLVFASVCATAAVITPDAVNNAAPGQNAAGREFDPSIIKVQILLDRAGFSPGEIDGKRGMNLEQALEAHAEQQGLSSGRTLTPESWSRLAAVFNGPVLIEYRLTEADLKGPFVAEIPAKLEDMKSLPALGYTSAREAIGEKFHMSEELLAALNPKVGFDRPGETIIVANVGEARKGRVAARVEIEKSRQTVKVFDRSEQLLAFYPASIGSDEKPSPSGTLRVTSTKVNPPYRYDPAFAFKGVKAEKPFTINPGPNNPVGLVWIGLSEKGYGIHGTPDPSQVSKAQSHGCVRMTNWDALSLAAMLKPGIRVTFTDGQQAAGGAKSREDRR